MVPLKNVRKDTNSPSDKTLRTLTLTSIPGSSDPIVKPSHSYTQQPSCSADKHGAFHEACLHKAAASHANFFKLSTEAS